MEISREIGGETVTITLTEEELNQAHVERVQRFMQDVLMSSKFRLDESHAALVSELALTWYCLGENELTAYDCVCREYAHFCDEFMFFSLEDFQHMIQKMISGVPLTEQFSTHAIFTMFDGHLVEAYAVNDQLHVNIVPLSEISLPENVEKLLRAIRENTLTVFDKCASLTFERRQNKLELDVNDFCAEVIPSEDKWKRASLSLGLLLKESGLA